MNLPTLRQLEYLVAIADHGGFHKAAAACFVTQPALSAQMALLEDLLGVTLLERSRRRVLPTEAGRETIERARAILAEVEALVESAKGQAEPLAGPLRLGVIPTVAPYLLPRVLPAVRKRHPKLKLRLREDRTPALVAALADGQLDLLLLALEADLGAVHAEPLFEDAFVAVVPRAHPLATRKRLREEELEGESILLLEDGHCLRDQVLSLCRRRGAPEQADFRATSLGTLVQMVAGGAGVTLLPALACDTELRGERGLRAVPFQRPAPARTIGLAWRRSSPRTDAYRLLAESLAPAGETRSRTR